MERLLATLERRYGRYAPPNLPWFIVGLSAIVYVLLMGRPDLHDAFTLSLDDLARGEVWRVVTFLFLPWQMSGGALGPFWTFLALYFLFVMATSLEQEWGSFRFAVFYGLAALGTIASSFFFGPVTNQYINQGVFLAFATVFPEYEILLFFILPVRVKWLGLLTGGFLVVQFLGGDLQAKAGILVALGSFFLFCGQTLVDRARGLAGGVSRSRRTSTWRATSAPARPPDRVCARCGRSEADDRTLEFRVCLCEKCGGKATTFCLAHAKDH